jgi:hypothetical protein
MYGVDAPLCDLLQILVWRPIEQSANLRGRRACLSMPSGRTL